MTDIELRNENGKIVGYDQSGNKIPVSYEALDTEELSNETGFAADAGQVLQGQMDMASWGMTQLPTDNWTKDSANNPVIPNDFNADTVFSADPFAVVHEGKVYVVFEENVSGDAPGISIAESGDGKTGWTYHRLVIQDPSQGQPFPHCVLYGGSYYIMTPLTSAGNVQLHKTSYSDFPTGWSKVWEKSFASGTTGAWDEAIKDPGMVFHNGKFWVVYAAGAGSGAFGHIGAKYTAGADIDNPTFQDAEWNGMQIGSNIQGFIPVQYGDTLQFFVHAKAETEDLALLTANQFNRSHIDLYQHPTAPLTTGADGSWDDAKLHHCYPVRVGDTWHLYYDGHDGSGNWEVGLATLEADG